MLVSKQNSYDVFKKVISVCHADVVSKLEKGLYQRVNVNGLGECIVCGNDEMFDGNDFYHYALLDDGRIMQVYYATEKENGDGTIETIDIENIDYSKPYKIIDVTQNFYNEIVGE
ncbi:MAG TPA: hypothetical protein GX745_09220 [Clostridiales bacterium]|nr:hypothetical protein [Clostridiales bacterium]